MMMNSPVLHIHAECTGSVNFALSLMSCNFIFLFFSPWVSEEQTRPVYWGIESTID